MAWWQRFPLDQTVEIFLSHVDRETGNIFVQLSNEDSPKLEQLMDDIANHTEENIDGNTNPQSLSVGDVCLAKYIDGVWYRGKILGVQKTGFKVFFVDYGNTDIVAASDITSSPERFLSLPPQAFECELANVKPVCGHWGTEVMIKLEELVLEQTFAAQAIALKSNNVVVLNIFQNTDLNKLVVEPLIAAGYLQYTGELNEKRQTTPTCKYKYLDLNKFCYEDVHVTYCESPWKFYCVLFKNSTALSKLQEELEVAYSETSESVYQLDSCHQGNPCCVKYSVDESWYRAVITSEALSSSGEVTVKFVDYGNSESEKIKC
ncbi:tudor domain-containing protein 1-like [Xenia sp. Carnegie-2017]|uniref:tudor domain-containing protein 1-like n=1 Tax=Xenia sp. Carnegie-2017 TaxID=2897299 RepID=UPI001F04B503|nr:tudor domain-containing protein 1-like [Xenia sp. Carnegie-2017]